MKTGIPNHERSEHHIQLALGLIQSAIEIARSEIFIDPTTAKDTDVLGILVSKWTEWDGTDIMRVAFSGLQYANFHTEAGKVADMYKEITGENPW